MQHMTVEITDAGLDGCYSLLATGEQGDEQCVLLVFTRGQSIPTNPPYFSCLTLLSSEIMNSPTFVMG